MLYKNVVFIQHVEYIFLPICKRTKIWMVQYLYLQASRKSRVLIIWMIQKNLDLKCYILQAGIPTKNIQCQGYLLKDMHMPYQNIAMFVCFMSMEVNIRKRQAPSFRMRKA